MVFDAKDMGDNVCKVCENDDCAVFRLRDEGGEGIMTVYDVFPGCIFCITISIWSTAFPAFDRRWKCSASTIAVRVGLSGR